MRGVLSFTKPLALWLAFGVLYASVDGAVAEPRAVAILALDASERGDHDSAARLAMVAISEARNVEEARLAEIVLRRSIGRDRLRRVYRYDQGVNGFAMSSDNGRLLILSGGTAHLIDTASGAEIARIAHGQEVRSVSFSPDDTRFLTTGWDNVVRIWHGRTGAAVSAFDNGDPSAADIARVEFARFSADGTRLVGIGLWAPTRIWNVDSGRAIARIQHPRRSPDNTSSDSFVYPDTARFSPDGALIATSSHLEYGARLWDAATGAPVAALGPSGTPPLTGGVAVDARFSADGGQLLTFRADRVHIFDVASRRQVQVIRMPGVTIRDASFSPDRALVATASSDGIARLWRAQTGERLSEMRHEGPVVSIHFSPNGQNFVTASEDGTVRVWLAAEVGRGREIARFEAGAPVGFARFSADGSRVLAFTNAGAVYDWNVHAGSAPLVRSDHGTLPLFSPTGTRFVTLRGPDRDRRTRGPEGLWDTETNTLVRELVSMARYTVSGALVDARAVATFSADGRELAAVAADNSVYVWRADTGAELSHWPGVGTGVRPFLIAPGGRFVLARPAGSPSPTPDNEIVQLWDAMAQRIVSTWTRPQSSIERPVFSPDGARLAGLTDNGAIIWDAATGREITRLRQDGEQISQVIFSRDGRRVITTAQEQRAGRIWDAATGRMLAALEGAAVGFSGRSGTWNVTPQVSPDGVAIAARSENGVALWNSTTGRLITPLHGALEMRQAVFSPDGALVATSSLSGDFSTIQIWDARSGLELLRFANGTRRETENLAFSADNARLLTYTGHTYIGEEHPEELALRVYDLSLLSLSGRALVDRACGSLLSGNRAELTAREISTLGLASSSVRQAGGNVCRQP